MRYIGIEIVVCNLLPTNDMWWVCPSQLHMRKKNSTKSHTYLINYWCCQLRILVPYLALKLGFDNVCSCCRAKAVSMVSAPNCRFLTQEISAPSQFPKPLCFNLTLVAKLFLWLDWWLVYWSLLPPMWNHVHLFALKSATCDVWCLLLAL
jgi:hypothetical protein